MPRDFFQFALCEYEAAGLFVDWHTFKLNPHGKAPWLQRLLFWLLGKLDAYDRYKTVTRITIEREKMEDYFHRTIDSILMTWPGEEIEAIYIGCEEFREIVRGARPWEVLRMTPGPIALPTWEWFGFPVIMVPWMKGILPVPKMKR